MATPEGKVKAVIQRMLDAAGAWYFMPNMGGFGRAGVPDFVGCINGLFFTVEAKAEGKKPTRIQDIEMREIRAAGGVCFVVVGTGDVEEFRTWLTKQRMDATSR